MLVKGTHGIFISQAEFPNNCQQNTAYKIREIIFQWLALPYARSLGIAYHYKKQVRHDEDNCDPNKNFWVDENCSIGKIYSFTITNVSSTSSYKTALVRLLTGTYLYERD